VKRKKKVWKKNGHSVNTNLRSWNVNAKRQKYLMFRKHMKLAHYQYSANSRPGYQAFEDGKLFIKMFLKLFAFGWSTILSPFPCQLLEKNGKISFSTQLKKKQSKKFVKWTEILVSLHFLLQEPVYYTKGSCIFGSFWFTVIMTFTFRNIDLNFSF